MIRRQQVLRAFALGFGALLVVSSCAAPIRLLKRHRHSSVVDHSGSAPSAALSTFSMPVPGAQPGLSALASLAGEGQAAAILELGKRASALPDFAGAVSAFPGVRAASGTTDLTKLQRRLVFSISPENFAVGDRVSVARIKVEVDNSVQFVSWDKFTTKHESIDLGKMTSTSVGTSPAISLVTPGIKEITGITLDKNASSTMAEEVTLRHRYVSLSGILSPHSALLIQEGVAGIDLVGNSVVDVQLDLSASSTELLMYSFGGLFEAARQPAAQNAVRVRAQPTRFMKSADRDIVASVSLDSVVRHVARGATTITESDDTVEYIQRVRPTVSPFVLIPKEELRFIAWSLVNSANEVLSIEGPGVPSEPVLVSRYDDLLEFLSWLEATGGASAAAGCDKVGNYTLTIGGARLTIALVRSLAVKPIVRNWTP